MENFGPTWYQRGLRYFRRNTIGSALNVPNLADPPGPLADYVFTTINAAFVSQHFDHTDYLKALIDVFVGLCRYLSVSNAHDCIDAHGRDETGSFHSSPIYVLIAKVCAQACTSSVPNFGEIFLNKIEAAVNTVANGGGGYEHYARSTSRANSFSPQPHHQPQQQEQQRPQAQADPEPHPRHPEQPRGDHAQGRQPEPRHVPDPAGASPAPAAAAYVAPQPVAGMGSMSMSTTRAMSMSERAYVEHKKTWLASDDEFFTADFAPYYQVLQVIGSPVRVPFKLKDEFFEALTALDATLTNSVFKATDPKEWISHLSGLAVKLGIAVSARHIEACMSRNVRDVAFTMMALDYALLQDNCKKNKDLPAPKELVGLIKTAALAGVTTVTSVAAFDALRSGKTANISVGGAQLPVSVKPITVAGALNW